MAKKNGWNADEMQGSLISDMEQEVKQGYKEMNKPADGVGNKVEEPIHPAPDMGGENRGGKFDNEPTKGVQANMPLSLYNRMKQLKFNTDQTFQSMFQEAMDLWLDVQEGKMKVQKVE